MVIFGLLDFRKRDKCEGDGNERICRDDPAADFDVLRLPTCIRGLFQCGGFASALSRCRWRVLG